LNTSLADAELWIVMELKSLVKLVAAMGPKGEELLLLMLRLTRLTTLLLAANREGFLEQSEN